MDGQIRPVMLWMTSRSRSSMVSAIFAQHGLFWGSTQRQSAGYDTYENQTVKALQKKVFRSLRRQDPVDPDREKMTVDFFLHRLADHVPSDKQWSIKTGVEFFHAFQPLNPYHIYITRKSEDVANSLVSKKAGATYQDALDTVLWRYNYMKQLQEEFGGVFVSTDKIIQSDFSEIQEAFEYCNIEFDKAAAERAIKR